ncbi:hypothetical protein GCM10023081_20060 [Arthrobacter ginkgonis]|uniref:Uncharacterized protein n=1 Tax=Arthrobacter ginkgonis TaxID=1630594 RepID=A0ABP7C9P7_9MICC
MTYIPNAPRFYSPSAPLKAALSSLAGYDARTRAMEALKAPLAQAKTAQQDAQDAAAHLAATLASDLLTAEPADAQATIEAGTTEAARAAENVRTAEATVKLLEAAEQHLGTELDTIIQGGYNQLLRHLNGTLQDAYAESRQLGLHGIENAEDAITAGKTDEWRRMVELRTLVFRIRDAQGTIVGRLGTHDAIQKLKTFAALRNYAELWPAWLEVGRGSVWGRENLTPPWPTVNGDPEPVGLHAWILDHPEAEPWVPTDAELAATVKDAKAAALATHAEQDA